jgi:hypothetical protein
MHPLLTISKSLKLGSVLLMLSTTTVFAGASTNALPPADPTAANLTPYEIKLRAFDACQVTQAHLMETTREAVHTPCSCYATRTVDAMSKEELADFRNTGYFNDTTREKALKSLDHCKLKRPI